MTLFFCLHTLVCLVGPSDIESLSAIRLIPCGEASPYTYISLLPPHVMRLVGPSGLEPPTSCLSGTRSNHLSYEPLSGAAPKPGFAFIFSFRSSCARNCHLHFWFSCVRLPKRWWRWWDSNPWPPACRAGALPAELHPHIYGTLLSLQKILQNWTTNQVTQTKPSFYVAYIL